MLLLVLIQIILKFTEIKPSEEIAAMVINCILSLVVFLGILFVYILLGFHTFLLNKSATTNEFCKDTWQSVAGNPSQKYISVLHQEKLLEKLI